VLRTNSFIASLIFAILLVQTFTFLATHPHTSPLELQLYSRSMCPVKTDLQWSVIRWVTKIYYLEFLLLLVSNHSILSYLVNNLPNLYHNKDLPMREGIGLRSSRLCGMSRQK
jgi:hypothetical protein